MNQWKPYKSAGEVIAKIGKQKTPEKSKHYHLYQLALAEQKLPNASAISQEISDQINNRIQKNIDELEALKDLIKPISIKVEKQKPIDEEELDKIASDPNTSSEVLKELLNYPDSFVRERARNNLNGLPAMFGITQPGYPQGYSLTRQELDKHKDALIEEYGEELDFRRFQNITVNGTELIKLSNGDVVIKEQDAEKFAKKKWEEKLKTDIDFLKESLDKSSSVRGKLPSLLTDDDYKRLAQEAYDLNDNGYIFGFDCDCLLKSSGKNTGFYIIRNEDGRNVV